MRKVEGKISSNDLFYACIEIGLAQARLVLIFLILSFKLAKLAYLYIGFCFVNYRFPLMFLYD